MTSRSLLPLFSAAALISVGAQTAGAQTVATQSGASSAAIATPALTRWDAHPTGKYVLQLTLPERIMKVDLTITDSAGTPTALFWPVGDNDGHVMTVAVKDTDMVLQADAPRGKVVVVLERQGDHLTGHWSMGLEGGALQGQVVEEGKNGKS